jgi:hypothetical protein
MSTNEKPVPKPDEKPDYKSKPKSKHAHTLDLRNLRPGDFWVDQSGRRYMKTRNGNLERVK